jgi:hypothetical protein
MPITYGSSLRSISNPFVKIYANRVGYARQDKFKYFIRQCHAHRKNLLITPVSLKPLAERLQPSCDMYWKNNGGKVILSYRHWFYLKDDGNNFETRLICTVTLFAYN